MLSKFHNPAQTLIERRDYILLENVAIPILHIIGMSTAFLIFIVSYYFPFEGNILFAISIFVTYMAYFSLKAYIDFKKLKRMNIGIIAERDVGNFLQQYISPMGYRVINSLNRDKYDIDHVIVGPSGIYCIETKNLQWLSGKLVTFDGEKIKVDNTDLPKKDPIKQAKSGAVQISEHLSEKEVHQFIKPVVLLPRRMVESLTTKNIIVANMKNFEIYIKNAETKLSPKQVKYFGDLISQLS